MYNKCRVCNQGPLTDAEIRRSFGSLCTNCMISLQAQTRCYLCQEFFTLDNLFVTVRDAKSVDICKPCSLAVEKVTKAVAEAGLAIHAPKEWYSEDGINWEIHTKVPSQTTWYTPIVNGININPPTDTPKEESEPLIIEPKPRRIKMKGS